MLPLKFVAPLGVVAGGAMALGQAPFSLWYVAFLGIVGVFWLFGQVTTTVRAALLGWLVGTAYFAGSLYWIMSPFQVDAARHGWMAPFALAFLAGGLALLWSAGFAWARWTGGARAAGLMLAIGWSGAELLRGYLFTGLPWGLVGYIWLDTPFAQIAADIGPYGLTLLTLVIAAGLASSRWLARIGAIAIIALAAALGIHREAVPAAYAEAPARIRLVQTNAEQHLKWQPDMISVFWERNLALTAQESDGLDLIVWPETAVPYLAENAAGAFDIMAQASGGVPIVAGIQRRDANGFYNSLVTLGDTGQVLATYDKRHLVPFGEYMPGGALASRLGLQGLAEQLGGGYTSGAEVELIDLPDVGNFLPLICYEAVFPRDLRVDGARPEWILHITNDAWFGKKAGPYQHLAQARMRAIEQGLPLVRAANTGVSAMIDPQGRVVAQLPLGVAGVLDVELPRPNPATLFAKSGNLPMIALFLLSFLGLTLYRVRR
ncbi:apolipoprotein N-acyltransferase [Falsihalocynthiibacter sp. SS001]|uniref:apolipoprotein N-acyltransferase n=1 Tax=Falsihalocynthiibacter sp. SS001 TaxID=3349698 RepID=UPI0036D2545A